MSYQLGIDLGTTYTAAAISRASDRTPVGADVVTLGARSATVASVMYLADDGSVLVGEAAERRALTDPDRVVREFKRRIGDEIPLMIGARQYQAHELAARMIRWVVDLVSEREGGPPRRIAVTHPASWGAHKKDLLGRALRDMGVSVTFLAEPQAAAVSYASAERVEPGSTIAVYDLGGGTFDAAVVRKTGNGGFELLGQPEGIERLGGVDFDEVVFSHVRESLGGQLEALDPEDPDVLSAVARLRRECVEAKEALSSDTEATIPVLLPDLRTQTRLVRAEFEAMIRPALEETIVALRRAVSSAGLTPPDLTAVLLVGGSSRIPLVSQLVSDELGRPVAVDADPKTAIAMGAALAISPQPAPARPTPQGTGGMPPVRGMAPGLAAGAAAGAATGYRSQPPGAPVQSGYGAAGGRGGPGAAHGHGGYSGGPGGPPRPPMAEPPRPEVQPAAFGGAGDDYDDSYYAEPAKRRQTGLLIGAGGLVAIAAILAAVFLWPSQSDAGGTGNSADLTPSTTAPATHSPETTRGNSGGRSTTTAKAPTKAPASTTVNHPPITTTKEEPPTSPETEPTAPTTTRQTTTSEPTPRDTGSTGGTATSHPGASQQVPGTAETTAPNTLSSPNTEPNGFTPGFQPGEWGTGATNPNPIGQPWAQDDHAARRSAVQPKAAGLPGNSGNPI